MAQISSLIEKINGGNNPFFKELYGTDATVLKEQSERYIQYMNEFKSIYGSDDVTLLSSPGRTEVGGNHTDHQLGRVLAGAVNLDNIAIVAPNGTNKVRITSIGFDPFEVDLDELEITEFQITPANLVRAIAAGIKELGLKIGGFDAVIHGCVPEGSGLSSSASIEVLIGAIFSNLFNDGKLDPVDNAKIGQKAEHACKKFCGLMDQTACAVGGFITIDFKDKADPKVKALNFDFAKTGYSLVITNTGGSHGGLDEEYNALPGEMKSVAKELGQEVLRPLSMEDIVKGIPTIREKVGDRALLRSIHFQGDNARVVDQVKALEDGKFDEFLALVIESGYSSYMYNQNIFVGGESKYQNVALALALSDLVLKGKGAWRVHGGGFAGTIQAFVPNDLLDNYISTLESVFGKGNCHKLFIRSKGAVAVEL
ncbi:galactokinase [Saccharicrinis fermentans]|uniref:Galactokinase n=1 Tax=Saccharicrinis fermentans DSM 9555 = JCM 21142 TaxID=869213 RepID=W7Y5N9_9BACT|nr:galactokinase family protein [Saccharicrinis fermentans]GAF03462.1 galactokinase [Saccharicrinis fermentans DSM 9555 = JCM 21142]